MAQNTQLMMSCWGSRRPKPFSSSRLQIRKPKTLRIHMDLVFGFYLRNVPPGGLVKITLVKKQADPVKSFARHSIWGFPTIRGTFFWVPIIRIMIAIFWGLYSGPLILGNYHVYDCVQVTIAITDMAELNENDFRTVQCLHPTCLQHLKALGAFVKYCWQKLCMGHTKNIKPSEIELLLLLQTCIQVVGVVCCCRSIGPQTRARITLPGSKERLGSRFMLIPLKLGAVLNSSQLKPPRFALCTSATVEGMMGLLPSKKANLSPRVLCRLLLEGVARSNV